MPKLISVPLSVVTLKFNEHDLLTPLSDLESLRLAESPVLLAGKYAGQFEKSVIGRNNYLPLVQEVYEGDYDYDSVLVDFQEAKNKFDYPAFSLEFDFYYKKGTQGFRALVPTLGVEAWANELEMLEPNLIEAIRLSFTRGKRLASVRKIVSAIWLEHAEIIQQDMKINVYSLQEQNEETAEEEKSWLERVADRLDVREQQVWFREKEMAQIFRAIENDFSRSVLLVGKSGVGKSALVMELARQRDLMETTESIWETTASRMDQKLTSDSGWEENMGTFCKELAASDDFLYLKNMLELFEVGQYEGSDTSMANVLQSYLSQDRFTVLAECTPEELSLIEVRAPSFTNYFQIIRIEEPTKDLEKMIVNKVQAIARHQQVKLERLAIEEVIRLNRRFAPYSGMPGRPIRFLESLLLVKSSNTTKVNISRREVIERFSEETGLPLFMIDPEIPLPLEKIKADFNEQVSGQELAIENVLNMLATVKTALSRTEKPIASYLFVGPTGVGKTELAKVLSEFMFGNRDRMIRFDMSEYKTPSALTRLTGASFFEEGLLTSAVRREPFSVLLFDEIEKADPGFFDLLLQVLDEGRLSDSRGKTVNFCSTIIIMTSNIGAVNLQDNRISWSSTIDEGEVKSHFENAVRKSFRPEFYNRIDRIIPFGPLSQPVIAKIVKREITQLKEREGIKFRNLSLELDPTVYDYLGVHGYDSRYGARYLQRTIREGLILPLSRRINVLDFNNKTLVKVMASEEKGIEFEIESDELALELWMEELNMITDANHASSLRRRMEGIQVSQIYLHLLSQVDQLETLKIRMDNEFWKDKKRTAKYTNLTKLKSTADELTAKIRADELVLSLIKMNLQPNQLEIRDGLKKWETDFWKLAEQLYYYENPIDQPGQMAIYGLGLEPILNFYYTIFTKKEFTWTAYGVWYREAYYNRIITIKDSDDDDLSIVGRAAEEYIIAPLELELYPDNPPPEKGDDLYGVIFEFADSRPTTYLGSESGYYKYVINEQLNFKYEVDIERVGKIVPPSEIFRQSNYGKPRRTLELGLLVDTDYKIRREINAGEEVDLIIKKLDEIYHELIRSKLGIWE